MSGRGLRTWTTNEFASFVRQLNKYDFHKVKSTDDAPSPYGDNVRCHSLKCFGRIDVVNWFMSCV
jgi:hypothetical protein